MIEIIASIRRGVKNNCLYLSLFTALAVPDICAAIDNGKTGKRHYVNWWNKYMTKYSGFLDGSDCYALRCSILHEGKSNISMQQSRKHLEDFVFMSSGAHMNLFKDCFFNGEKRSFLEINVPKFCEDVCLAVESWLSDFKKLGKNINRLDDGLTIHDSGYVHLGLIRFQ